MTDTRNRYMDAAETAFIRNGYEGATIRSISARAKVPLGTLHHYWGTKERLFAEVCQRRFQPIQAVQVERFMACAAAVPPGGRPAVADVVRALVEPPILAANTSPKLRQRIRMMYGRVLTEPSDVVTRQAVEVFRESTQWFLKLMQQACPELDARTFYWRFTCALGAFIFTQSFSDRVALGTGYELTDDQWPVAVDEIVGFVVRGMSADQHAGPADR
jgi:AcrR family transcriptional regulator